MKLVSIITPAYNAGQHIEETIKSVLKQTYKNWEMLIVDDGSTDNTKEVVARYLSDSRIKYYLQENGKQGKARNNAMGRAKGEYLAFLDADDLWVSNKLELQVKLIEEEGVDVVYSAGWSFLDTADQPDKVERKANMDVLSGYSSSTDFLGKLLTRNQIPILSVLLRKKAANLVEGFSEKRKVQNAEDYQFWIKLADHGCSFYGMEERFFYYRIHQSQSTSHDNMSMIPSIWGVNELVFKSISDSEKKRRMHQMLNQYVLFKVDHGQNKYFAELLELYKDPLNQKMTYIMRKILLFFGVKFFKKIGYKFFKV